MTIDDTLSLDPNWCHYPLTTYLNSSWWFLRGRTHYYTRGRNHIDFSFKKWTHSKLMALVRSNNFLVVSICSSMRLISKFLMMMSLELLWERFVEVQFWTKTELWQVQVVWKSISIYWTPIDVTNNYTFRLILGMKLEEILGRKLEEILHILSVTLDITMQRSRSCENSLADFCTSARRYIPTHSLSRKFPGKN